MTDATWRYLAQLVVALRQYGVRGTRIGDHVAEIAQHLDDSDADPTVEFGAPGELAARLAEDERRIPPWMRSFLVRLATMTLAMAGVAIAMSAIISATGRASVTLGGIVGAVGMGVLIVTLSRLVTDRLDGHSAWSAVRWRVVVVWLAGSALVSIAGAADRVVAEWTRSSALIGGVLLVAAGIGLAALADSPVRFPPHAQHLDRLRRGFLAGHAPTVPTGR
ncbi:MAG: hypothetical protein ABIO83_01750 [Ilumatobacteraceae bacterium]